MNQFKEQLAIIEKIKRLVINPTKLFRPKKESGISEAIAKKIQKSAYDLSHQKEKQEFTPPYKAIVEQLQIEEDQIFRAAVHQLAGIAVNEDKYAPDIIEKLEKYASNPHKTREQQEYARKKADEIRRIRNKKI